MPSRGELEQRVMELLWVSDEPRSVADVHAALSTERELAYTTVMTVLDRLAKKGLVDRELVNRAWQYRAHNTQAEVLAAEVVDLLSRVPDGVRLDALARLAATLSPHERAAVSTSGVQ
ncbi:BlaI/MecI/CopY family transcriptional regulator [Tessaracoccus sp.]|uniref:BlaI/MecI/CopY family transcriptional regulator n=1 Tax=Tessaracoccus sp. TaxID=1971211 RepID=UPI002625E3A1|nr:BlaI/MecI/CopY family transcriptional regulator [Tessaracoccus sp.]